MPHKGTPTLPVNGPWLNGSYHHIRNSPWFTYGKTTQIVRPSPSGLFVLLDEDYRSINDAGFAVTMVANEFKDAPGSYHNLACGFAFADGHSEIHRWRDGRTPVRGTSFGATVFSNPLNQDVIWLQERTSAHK